MSKNIFFVIVIVFFSSCYNTKYLNRDAELEEIEKLAYSLNIENYKLQPYDNLYISVKSANEEINNLYDNIMNDNRNIMGGAGAQSLPLIGYTIDDDGYISVPTLGEVMVKDKTVKEAEEIIKQKFNELLIDAFVKVKLTTFNVTFVGTINSSVSYYKERINLLEGIGMAGGIPRQGDKKRVKIYRSRDTLMDVYEIDLTKKELIERKEFYLYPNDVIYIPKRRYVDFLEAARDYTTFIALLTSTITTTFFIIELTNRKKDGK